MVLLLCRCWEYQLKTEDILELTQGNRSLALLTVVGLLEDGETYSTTLKQRQKPGQGQIGQWEHELVINRYEKPLLLQICRLLRGFTHPGTYFGSSSDDKDGEEIALNNVELFSTEIDSLLEISIRSRIVEKLSMSLYDCFEFDRANVSNSNDENSSSPFQSATVLNSSSSSSSSTNNLRSTGHFLEESDHLAIACVHAFLQVT
jgi:hypothetical protein